MENNELKITDFSDNIKKSFVGYNDIKSLITGINRLEFNIVPFIDAFIQNSNLLKANNLNRKKILVTDNRVKGGHYYRYQNVKATEWDNNNLYYSGKDNEGREIYTQLNGKPEDAALFMCKRYKETGVEKMICKNALNINLNNKKIPIDLTFGKWDDRSAMGKGFVKLQIKHIIDFKMYKMFEGKKNLKLLNEDDKDKAENVIIDVNYMFNILQRTCNAKNKKIFTDTLIDGTQKIKFFDRQEGWMVVYEKKPTATNYTLLTMYNHYIDNELKPLESRNLNTLINEVIKNLLKLQKSL